MVGVREFQAETLVLLSEGSGSECFVINQVARLSSSVGCILLDGSTYLGQLQGGNLDCEYGVI